MKNLLALLLLSPILAFGSTELRKDRGMFFNEIGIGVVSGAPSSTIDAVGGSALLPGPSAAPADSLFTVSQWSLWLDEGNDEFELKAQKSNGTFITQTVGAGGGGATFETQRFSHTANGSTLTDRTNELEFSIPNIVSAGDTLITVADDSGNTRTTFTADHDIAVSVSFSARLFNSSDEPEIYLNGSLYHQGSDRGNLRGEVTAHLTMATNDILTINMNGGQVNNGAEPCSFTILAWRVF